MNYGYRFPRETPAPSEARRRAQLRQIERQSRDSTTPEQMDGFSRVFAVSIIDARKVTPQTKPA